MKPTIDLYENQHARALQCAGEISAIIGLAKDLKSEANQVRLLLAQLAGVLKPHFMSEDHLVYPMLISSKDPKVSEIAQRFWNEMGSITDVVNTFMTRWRTTGEIENDPENFKAECQSIFAALKNRIDAEEKELYPLFLANLKS